MQILQSIELGQKQAVMVKQYNSTAATVGAIWKSIVEIKHAFIDRPGNALKIKNKSVQKLMMSYSNGSKFKEDKYPN